jgi:hypothetical protein
MIERGDGLRFALTTIVEFFSGDFYGDFAIEPRMPRAVQGAHPARADGRENFLRAEFVASGKRHWVGIV